VRIEKSSSKGYGRQGRGIQTLCFLEYAELWHGRSLPVVFADPYLANLARRTAAFWSTLYILRYNHRPRGSPAPRADPKSEGQATMSLDKAIPHDTIVKTVQ